MQLVDLKHRRAAERQKATIVRSIATKESAASAAASAATAGNAVGEYSAGWFKKMPNTRELGRVAKTGFLKIRVTGVLGGKSWKRKWTLLPEGVRRL